ncbi:MAG: vWA domain-containing protein [Cyanobium sp.]
MPFPNVKLSRRPLHFIYICDCSGSMEGQGKMQSLNQAIRQSLPAMAEVAQDNPEASVLVRAVSFASQAQWHIPDPTPASEVAQRWQDLTAQKLGLTAMGAAMRLVAQALRTPPMEQRALPPVLVLISDGAPTDDYSSGLQTLLREPWAQKAVRLSIAIGHDADHEHLQAFIGPDASSGASMDANRMPGASARNPLRPLQANDARTLARYMKWASTAVIGAVSRPVSETGEAPPSRNVTMPDLPTTVVDLLDPTPDLSQITW